MQRNTQGRKMPQTAAAVAVGMNYQGLAATRSDEDTRPKPALKPIQAGPSCGCSIGVETHTA